MKNLDVVSFRKRLIETFIHDNNLIWLGVVLFFIIIGMPLFLLAIWILVLLVFLYFSYKRALFYLYNIIDMGEFVEIHFLKRNSYHHFRINKEFLKIDYVDSGAYNIRIYSKSKLILKQYQIDYWTKERLSKFYEFYCKGEFEIPS